MKEIDDMWVHMQEAEAGQQLKLLNWVCQVSSCSLACSACMSLLPTLVNIV